MNIPIIWGSYFISIPMLLVVIWAGIRYYAKKSVDQQFAKKLEQHKHDLQLIIEQNKFDIQRKMHDFSLYTTKRHEIYTKLYSLFMTAQGSVASMWGYRQIPDFAKFNAEELKKYLLENDVIEEKMIYFLNNWEFSERRETAKEIQKLYNNIEIMKARKEVIKTHNEHLYSRLYLSDTVSDICGRLSTGLRQICNDLEEIFNDEIPNRDKVDVRRELNAKLDRVSEEMIELKEHMQKELAIGYYEVQ
ncbi:hypothetical protein ACN6KS_21305 [Paenibacillus nitricinens]|uniref:hypothetical protein n=1 Tax=Paenibacillus nitricinens TaxID=3367691 RepID=UPI003F830629